MPEKIIIEFDDDAEKPKDKSEDNRIVIDFDDQTGTGDDNAGTGAEDAVAENVLEIDDLEADYEQKIRNSEVSSMYAGNAHLNKSFDTDLKFPEGIEQGFRKKFSLNLKDDFFNSILANNRFIILASKKSSVYLIDRFTGKVTDKLFFDEESFEKTGIVHNNTIYLNSLNKVYRLRTDDIKTKYEDVYCSPEGFFIWSNLNRNRDLILLTEYDIQKKKAHLKIIDTLKEDNVTEFEISIQHFVSDRICVADGFAYLIFDQSVLIFDLDKMTGEIHRLNINTDENSFIFYLNYRVYITAVSNELFYLDLPPVNYNFKTTGIRNSYINSIGGFADNIFIGTLDGWKYYKSSGLQVYRFEDEYENKIECISKNVLVISQSNKIVFCNLSRFQEAEGYVLSSNETNENIEIISAYISGHEIFVLTSDGILEIFTNDKLNIHI